MEPGVKESEEPTGPEAEEKLLWLGETSPYMAPCSEWNSNFNGDVDEEDVKTREGEWKWRSARVVERTRTCFV